MFHMEHCVFCAFLSTGKDYRDCGRPCDTARCNCATAWGPPIR
jgi:putative protease